MKPWLRSGHRKFYLQELFQDANALRLSDVEKKSLDFCIDWMRGKTDFILFTSGSTGNPKEIHVSREQLKASAELTITALELKVNQTALVCLDTHYVAGIMMLVRALEAHMNIILVEPCSNPLENIDARQDIDFAALVPMQVITILNSPQRVQFERIKKVIIGGAPLPKKTQDILRKLNNECYATYGMTETLSHVALQKINGEHSQDFFEALSGITFSCDLRGCLIVQAPHLSAIPYITNDLVELISTSRFRWIGRIDTVINTGGVKVIPEKVENIIQTFLDELEIPNRLFVTGINDEILGNTVALIVEGNEFSDSIQIKLNHFLREKLTRFEIPRKIYFKENFIQTDTGKVNKIETIHSILNTNPASSS